MSNLKSGINSIPRSFGEFVDLYPDVASDLARTKTANEWNDVREKLKESHSHLLAYIDTSRIIRNKREIRNLLANK